MSASLKQEIDPAANPHFSVKVSDVRAAVRAGRMVVSAHRNTIPILSNLLMPMRI